MTPTVNQAVDGGVAVTPNVPSTTSTKVRGIRLQPRAVGLVRSEAVEGNHAPGDVVGPLVRQEVPDQVTVAARDDAPQFSAYCLKASR